MRTGIGLILVGFAVLVLVQPYREVVSEGEGERPRIVARSRLPLRFKRMVPPHTRGGAAVSALLGQLCGLAGMVAGVVLVIQA
jgi:hypothetical protein